MTPAWKFSDDEDDEDEDDDEDDTAELLRELEKIKRERAEEKERQEREQSAASAAEREVEIATANPLLNLAAALGQTPGISTTAPGSFTVKRRWDDGRFPVHHTSGMTIDTLCAQILFSRTRP